MNALVQLSSADYEPTLRRYITDRSEAALYQAGILSCGLLDAGMGPEDVVSLHVEMLDRVIEGLAPREVSRAHLEAHQFLLEIMIAYGVHYKEYLEMRVDQTVREADRIGREKNEILANIAHELRSPLTAATTYIGLAERSLQRGLTEELPRALSGAKEALTRLSRLSADLVEASRDGEPTIELSVQEIGQLVAQACAWGGSTAAAKQLVVTLDADAREQYEVLGSADALLSVFGNLLSNAVRYSRAGEEITLRVEATDSTVVVICTDHGIGIPESQQAQIFTRFYRSPEAREVEPQGLGLGLTLVEQLVRAHGGHVEVESEAGKGSSFRVVLPRYQPNTDGSKT